MSLRLKFVGALDTVTGSCHLVHNTRSDTFYMIDCGMFQGIAGADSRNVARFDGGLVGGVPITRLKTVLLTHAHMDHCGLIPALYRRGFTGTVICTKATADFTRASLEDTARMTNVAALGLFDMRDVERVRFVCPDERADFQLGRSFPVEQDLFLSFTRSAHLVGGVAIEFIFNDTRTRRQRVMFAGDVGPVTDSDLQGSLLRSVQYPAESVQYLVLESTYGGRVRERQTLEGRIATLAKTLEESFARGDAPVVLVAAFSLQRTHEILMDVVYLLEYRRELMPSLARFASPPMVVTDSALARTHGTALRDEFVRRNGKGKANFLNQEHPLLRATDPSRVGALLDEILLGEAPAGTTLGGCRFRQTIPHSVGAGPLLVISSSGMCAGGRIVGHLRTHLSNPACTVLLAGYQAPRTPGAELAAMPTWDAGTEVPALAETVGVARKDVRASVGSVAACYSGHADAQGLVDYALRQDRPGVPYAPITVFLVHGEQVARRELRARLQDAAFARDGVRRRALRAVHAPEPGSGWFDCGTGAWVVDAPGAAELASARAEEVAVLTASLAEVCRAANGVLDGVAEAAERLRQGVAEARVLLERTSPGAW